MVETVDVVPNHAAPIGVKGTVTVLRHAVVVIKLGAMI